MKVLTTLVVVSVVIAGVTGSSLANPTTPPYIQGTSTATLVEGGFYDGWYRYDIEIVWDLDETGVGLSHWDLILMLGCAETDHLIVFDPDAGFDTYAGYSRNGSETGDWEFGWLGYFEREGDDSVTSPITNPVIKFNEAYDLDSGGDVPGAQGYGTFSFYSNIIPEYGTYTDALVAKAGQVEVSGNLEGAYPSCTIIPAPGVLILSGIGTGFIAWLRRRRML